MPGLPDREGLSRRCSRWTVSGSSCGGYDLIAGRWCLPRERAWVERFAGRRVEARGGAREARSNARNWALWWRQWVCATYGRREARYDAFSTSYVPPKQLVLEAFDTLFNKRDYEAAARFWSPDYIQHSAHIAPGRDGLFNLIRGIPDTLRYESGTILADEEYVMVHSRFSGNGRTRAWIGVDIVRIENGLLAEHWDVLQDEATETESQSKMPMFGTRFSPEA